MEYELFGQLVQRSIAIGKKRFLLVHSSTAEARPLWTRITASVMAVVMYFAPAVLLADQAAHAAPPIVDPRAPIQFQPTIRQTSTGVPAVSIAAPNANGISVNQFSSLNVDPAGLVFNNSLVAGTPLLGGTLSANPNLSGRAATTILNQVTSTAPSALAGPVEIFGSPASLIISNPNGVSVSGLSVTNARNLVLTTGVPQFITGPGGSPATFANAGAVSFAVSSGDITVNGPPGVNGPGAGIEGTVGNIDLIGQSVHLNAPLYANQTVNVIAGNQTVTPAITTAAGTTYSTSNVVAGQPGVVAIDASQYGSVTSGQIFIVSTAAGQGVNLQGALAGTAGNVSVNSNGDIVVGQTFANQNVNLTSAGSTSITSAGLANQNYTVSAAGDINASGSVSGGQDVSLTAGNDLNAASVAANGQASLVAGDSMTLGSLSANAINLQTQNGDLTVNSALTAPGAITTTAGRDLTINGAVQGGSTVALTGARNTAINGSVNAVGDATITAQTGSASVSGNVQSNGALSTTAAQDVSLGGTVLAQGPVSVTATNGSITGQGSVASSNDAVTLTAGQNVQAGASLQAGTNLSVDVAPQGGEAPLDIPLGTPVDQITETGPTFRVERIVLAGPTGEPVAKTAVSESALDAITAPFAGHDLGSRRVNVLLRRITGAYVSAGYVTTRALLGPQNIGSGTLVITIQTGRIEAFTVNGKPIHRLVTNEKSAGGGWLTDEGYQSAFPSGPGDPLRLSDIDQGVAQINRMRRNQAQVQVLPGQGIGDSVIAISNPPGDRTYYTLGVDNYGAESTGVTRYRAGFEADNLIGLQEVLSLNYIDSVESNALVGSLAVPWGRHTFSYTLSDSEYQQVIGTSALQYGRTLSHIFGWNYQLERTQADMTALDATLSWCRTDREINDIDLDPQRLAVLRVGGNWLHRFVMNDAQANVTLDGGVSQGLPWLGADHDGPDIPRDYAHSQFTKLDATATFMLPLPKIGSAVLAYRGTLGGQFTNVALYGSEQLYLGGMDTIRGFRSGDYAGDRGFYSRNELAWVNVPVWHDGRVEPYVFLDAGKASLVALPGFPTLAGVGAGLRAQWQWRRQLFSAEGLMGYQLCRPASIGPRATLALGTVNWSF